MVYIVRHVKSDWRGGIAPRPRWTQTRPWTTVQSNIWQRRQKNVSMRSVSKHNTGETRGSRTKVDPAVAHKSQRAASAPPHKLVSFQRRRSTDFLLFLCFCVDWVHSEMNLRSQAFFFLSFLYMKGLFPLKWTKHDFTSSVHEHQRKGQNHKWQLNHRQQKHEQRGFLQQIHLIVRKERRTTRWWAVSAVAYTNWFDASTWVCTVQKQTDWLIGDFNCH